MTKKSQGRQQRDRAAQARAHALATGTPQEPQIKTKPYRPANLGGFKPTENGGFKLTAADRILAECRQGAGVVPGKMKNTCWDDLMEVYREAASMLYKHTMVSQLLADNELLTYLDDHVTFNMNVKQFAADLGQINKELAEILAQHTGKTGGSDDPDEVLASFAVYEQYKLWMTRHDGVINPTVTHILEQTNAAELKRAAAHQVAAAGLFNGEAPAENLDAGVLDVNTITDVQFKDGGLNIQASIDAGLEASKPETVDEFLEGMVVEKTIINPNAKPLRGGQSPIYTIDEAGFVDPQTKQPVYVATPSGRGEHNQHEHQAST